MIHHITGTIEKVAENGVVIQTGPIGFQVQMPSSARVVVGKSATIYLYMHWNQENGPSWFGFDTPEDKEIFMLVISCSGIGPRIGLAVLSSIGGSGFIDAVQTGDDRILSKVNGIGKKKAEQMIVQLKHKIAQQIKNGALAVSAGSAASEWHTITQALEALGYSSAEVQAAINHLRSLEADQMSFDQLMRKALSFLSKQ